MNRAKNTSLASLIRVYRYKYGPRLIAYLDYFERLNSLDDAIRFACHGRDGKIHSHQRRIGRVKLEQARKSLVKHSDEIAACESFGELLNLVEKRTARIERFGVLTVYDTSLRLGAHLKLWPEIVYLHAGTKKGCKALGVDTGDGTVDMEGLPKPLRVLVPYQAEDFLCIFKIFKAQLAGASGKGKFCASN